MIHAMVWAFVLTSGAGMSRSGPIRIKQFRRDASSFRVHPYGHLLRIADDATLAPPNGTLTTAFQVIRRPARIVNEVVWRIPDAALAGRAQNCAAPGSLRKDLMRPESMRVGI
jgi:hypothetical protein